MLQIAGAKVRSANMTKAENLRRGDTQGALLVVLKCKVRTRKCENNQCGMGRADFTLHLECVHGLARDSESSCLSGDDPSVSFCLQN